MKKRNLPTGNNRKRWIEKLSDEDYKSLSKEDSKNLREFQESSRNREQKTKTLNELRRKVKLLKEEIIKLNVSEESSFVKIQHLHNTMGCKIEITRQKKESDSLKKNKYTYGGTIGNINTGGSLPYLTSKSGLRNTYKGKELKTGYIYHGKIKSNNLKKPKSIYFQEESKLFTTINKLTGVDISKNNNPLDSVKKLLIPIYKEYIIYLMRKMGSEKFEDYSVKFTNFVKWYNSKT